jgi:RNA polymerase sigma-70 factor (ECF subfamily)
VREAQLTWSREANGARLVGTLDAAANDAADNLADAFPIALPRLKRVVAAMGFGPADADDILQDVFVEATQRPGQYRGPEQARRWLLRVTVNRCLLEYRRRSRFQRAAAEIQRAGRAVQPTGSLTAATSADQTEEIELIREALRELDGSLAAPLVLRYFCDHNATEIGDILDLPATTVRGRLRTARMFLAERLTKKGVAP